MRWQHLGVTALAILIVGGGSWLTAREKPGAKAHDRVEALAAKLGLSDEQKEKIRKIHADFDPKADKLEAEIRELRHNEMEAASQVLTESQREKAKELFKVERQKELHNVEDKLGLSSEQKQTFEKIRAEYGEKIHKLEGQNGEKVAGEIRELRHREFAAIRQMLTEGQRAKAPGILREDFREWRNPADKRKRLEAIADKLDLSKEQRDKLEKIFNQHDQKRQKLVAQLRELHHDEHQAVEKVLTDEQRGKLQELLKARKG